MVFLFLLISSKGLFGQNDPSVKKRKGTASTITQKAKESFVSARFGFIENKGQVVDQNKNVSHSARFILPLPNNNVSLSANGFSYDTYVAQKDCLDEKPAMPDWGGDAMHTRTPDYTHQRIDVELLGANKNPEVVLEEKAKDFIVYSSGPEDKGIRVNHYGKVIYKNIYPDIDVEFIAKPVSDKPIEYNFIVHPCGDASNIKLRYTGANCNELVGDRLELNLANGKLTERIPLSYWAETEEKVEVKYSLVNLDNESGPNNSITVGFDYADKTNGQTLVIDPTPTLIWRTQYGSIGGNYAIDIAVDVSNNVYLVGFEDAFGSASCFISKYTSSGTRQFTRYFGSNYRPEGLVIDPAGMTYVTGNNLSVNNGDAFVWKLDVYNTINGANTLWAASLGGTGLDRGMDLAIDASGNVFVTGQTSSTTGIATPGVHQSSYGGGSSDAFLTKYNSSGTRQWVTYFGGSSSDGGLTISVDNGGNPVLSGTTSSTTSISSAGSFQNSLKGVSDSFTAKFNTNGIRQWSTYYGGLGNDEGNANAIDASGNIYVTGQTQSASEFATVGSHQISLGGTVDSYVLKFNGNGAMQWCTYYGGSGIEQSTGINVNPSGDILLIGYTSSATPAGAIASNDPYQNSFAGGDADGFIAKFSPEGIRLFGTYFGSVDSDQISSVTSNTPESIYISGGSYNTSGFSTYFPAKLSGTISPPCISSVATCIGNQASISIGCGISIVTYTWWTSATGGSQIGSGAALPVGPFSSEGVYRYYAQANYNGLASSRTEAIVTVSSAPSPPFSITPSPPWYVNKALTFTDGNPQVGTVYNYTFGDGATLPGTTASSAQHSYTTPGTYPVSITATVGGCQSAPYTTNVIINPVLPLCVTALPTTSGQLKLDKFSGKYIYQPSAACSPELLVGCVGGQTQSPVLQGVVSASASTLSDTWDYTGITSATLGANPYETGQKGKWRTQSGYTFKTDAIARDRNYNTGTYTLSHFNWRYPEAASKNGWLLASKVEKTSPNGDPVEESNALKIKSSAKFGYRGSVPYLTAKNAGYGSVLFEGFEVQYYRSDTEFEDGFKLLNGTVDATVRHSGRSSLKLPTGGDLELKAIAYGSVAAVRPTLVKVWVRLNDWGNYGNLGNDLSVKVKEEPGILAVKMRVVTRANNIDGAWALCEATLTNIGTRTTFTPVLNYAQSQTIWVDDVRVQPADSEMNAYVYDSKTLRLVAVFDDQHFGLYYQYNAEGKLVRKMIETERGLKTLEETQYNVPVVAK